MLRGSSRDLLGTGDCLGMFRGDPRETIEKASIVHNMTVGNTLAGPVGEPTEVPTISPEEEPPEGDSAEVPTILPELVGRKEENLAEEPTTLPLEGSPVDEAVPELPAPAWSCTAVDPLDEPVPYPQPVSKGNGIGLYVSSENSVLYLFLFLFAKYVCWP